MSAKGLLGGPWSGWSIAKALEDMDRDGVATSVASITTPGVWLDSDAQARGLARDCNEAMAALVHDHPGRFGAFAALPLPDVEGSLREIEYALDVLKHDGVGVMTSYRDRWLGDAAHIPVLDELNRRKAILYVHPTAPCACTNCLPYLRDSVIEYGTDTTRAIASLVFTGLSTRYPDIRTIFSHAGGTMPFLIERFFQQKRAQELAAPGKTPSAISREELAKLDPLKEVQRFYYDVAQSTHAAPMAALRQVVPVSQVLFGTDYPYRTAAEHVEGLRHCGAFSAVDVDAIGSGNARRLMPRYAR
jgi:predicted TIM-barrel fold metal-dependent hydrolase